jgi:gamma-glutamyltranspeptidase
LPAQFSVGNWDAKWVVRNGHRLLKNDCAIFATPDTMLIPAAKGEEVKPLTALDFCYSYPSSRFPVLDRNAVAASQPLAAQAGLHMLFKGGNAAVAAVATAMAPAVTEPTGCGFGADAFAIVFDGENLHGLNSSGRSPAVWARERFGARGAMLERGFAAVTVPGAMAAWVELIASSGGEAFYRGTLAEAIAAIAKAHGAALNKGDLAAHTADWVKPAGRGVLRSAASSFRTAATARHDGRE